MDSRNLRNIWIAGLGVAAVIFMPLLLEGIAALGWRIPQPDRVSDYLNGVCLATLIAVFLAALPLRADEKRALLIVWAAKCAVSLGAALYYEWHYTLDAFWYFDLSQQPTLDPTTEIGFGHGTDNLEALLWGFEHFVYRTYSYHAQKILVSFMGLVGIFALYRGLRSCSDRATPRLFMMIGLFPSVLFWSSILGKDPFNLLGNCLFFYGLLSFYKKRHPVYLLPIAASLWFVAMIRVWLVPVLLAPLIIVAASRIRTRSLRFVSYGVMIAALGYGLQRVGRELAIDSSAGLANQVNYLSKSWNLGGSATEVPDLSTPTAMLRFLPIGMFTALFRPLPGEVNNPFGLFAGLENLFLLYLLFRSARNFTRQPKESRTFVAIGAIFILIWSMLYAFISPQNLGAAARFKLQVLPILLALLYHLSYPPREKRSPSLDLKESWNPSRDRAYQRS